MYITVAKLLHRFVDNF